MTAELALLRRRLAVCRPARSSPGLCSQGRHAHDRRAVVTTRTPFAHSVTVRAFANGVSASGGTNPGVPFEQATVGVLTVSVAAGATEITRLGDTDRHTQASGIAVPGLVGVDVEKFWVLVEPYDPLQV
jgi:hypothetical protein